MSDKERQTQMEELRRHAVMTTNPYNGIKAVEAAYGEEAIPKLLGAYAEGQSTPSIIVASLSIYSPVLDGVL
ncbi:MAG: hypothetical protein WAM14_21865 [Candidatus Nitrosopolaris sp.]